MRKAYYIEFPGSVPPAQVAAAATRGELERFPEEPDHAYRAFLEYCANGPTGTLADIARSIGMGRSGISRVRKRYHWLARIERWWAQQEQQKEAAVMVEDDSGVAERQKALRDAEWRVHKSLLHLGEEALARWRASKHVPSLNEIAKVLELASRIGRLAAGLPLTYTEISGNPAAPIRIELEAALARAYGPAEVIDVNAEDQRS